MFFSVVLFFFFFFFFFVLLCHVVKNHGVQHSKVVSYGFLGSNCLKLHSFAFSMDNTNTPYYFNSVCLICISENKHTNTHTHTHTHNIYSNKYFKLCHGKRASIAYANSKGSGEPAHPRSLARTCAFRSCKLMAKGKHQPKK